VTVESFRNRLRHEASSGAYFDRDIRYMLIRPDALMGMFARLTGEAREAAFAAIADSITERGRNSAESYVAADEIERLLGVIAATAPELGWGVWRFDVESDGAIALTVHNSPFAAAAGELPPPVCFPIVGMLRAVGAMVFSAPVEVTEIQCAAGGGDTCRFTIERT
jgi:predicted hydrocarbon binding protein